MEQGEKAKSSRGNKRIIWGCICFAFGLIGFSTSVTDGFNSTDIVTVLLFLGGGTLLVFFGYKAKKQYAKYKRYMNIVINKNQTNIDNIASETKDSPQKVGEILLAMLEIGFFPGAYIDENLRKLVLPNAPIAHPQTTTVQTSIKKCPGCGANNTLVAGKVIECEYCGSPL